MTKSLKVMLAGRSERVLWPLVQALAGVRGIECTTHPISDGQTDTLSELDPRPDVLVLRFDADSRSELAALAESSADSRPPLIVMGPAGDAEAMRLAVRSGARDFLPEPFKPEELVAAVERLRDSLLHGAAGSHRAEVTVVLGAAGGVGTSTVACNLAYSLAIETLAPTLLLDLDTRAAPLTSFLDLSPERGLPSAVAEAQLLDEQALTGYVAKHASGLRLLGTPAKSLVSPNDIDLERFATLMGILSANYRHIVVDASHELDDLSVTTIGMARHVVLVVQQSVVQVKQAARILGALCNEIGIPSDRVLVVVNRYLKHSTVALDDIRRALGNSRLMVLPSHYKTVLASIDSGVPLLEYDPGSSVSKAIVELQHEIAGGGHAHRPGLLRRALPIFSGD